MGFNDTWQALAEPNRRKIIDLLKKQEMAVWQIKEYINVSLPTLSHHLDILKRADLISSRRQGQEIFYSLNLSVLEEITEQIIKFLKK